MAMSLKDYLNSKIKSKGSSLTKEKAKASKYKSISAAKKAGALYYTNKDGKVMAAIYAEDLKKAKPKLGAGKQPKVTVRTLSDTRGGRGDGSTKMGDADVSFHVFSGRGDGAVVTCEADARTLHTFFGRHLALRNLALERDPDIIEVRT